MGTNTTHNNFYKPVLGEVDWYTNFIANFDALDVKTLKGIWVKEHESFAAAITAAGTTLTDIIVDTPIVPGANWTIPATARLVIMGQGKITKTSTYTGTINGQFYAPERQVFFGYSAGDITGLKTVLPEWWGAGPFVANNTPYLESAVTSLAAYGMLVLTQKYPITSEWAISGLTDFTIDFRGGYLYPTGCSAMKLSGSLRGEIKRLDIQSANTYTDSWAGLYSGLTLDDVGHVKLDIKRIDTFYKGLSVTPSAGKAVNYMNDITVGEMIDNKYDIYIDPTAIGSSVTEMSFIGGRYGLRSSTYAAVTGDYLVYIVDGTTHDASNIRFYSPCFETKHNGIYAIMQNMLLSYPRFEGIDANWLEGTITESTFLFGAGRYIASMMNLDVASYGNVFLGPESASGMTMIGESGTIAMSGLGFVDPYGRNVIHKLYSSSNYNTLIFKDSVGKIQYFNKQYDADAEPTTGTYIAGTVVWKTTPVVGASIGWICRVGGTQGTLAGITATGTSGETHVHVNSVSGLRVGDIITIVGTSSYRTIYGIKGTTVYLNVAINADVAGAAVAYKAATFEVINAQLSYRSSATDPVTGTVTPYYIGEEYYQTTGHWYKAHALTAGAWTALN